MKLELLPPPAGSDPSSDGPSGEDDPLGGGCEHSVKYWMTLDPATRGRHGTYLDGYPLTICIHAGT